MTNFSAWLVGMVAVTAPFLMFYLNRTIIAQFMAGGVTWGDSRPTRLAVSMVLLLLGLGSLILAALVSPGIAPVGLATYLIWTAWSIIWIAEIVALSAIGRVSPALASSALWTVTILVLKGMI